MLHEITISKNPINLQPATVVEEVLQNCRMILSTPQFTVPFAREFAMSGARLDNPTPKNIALLKRDIIIALKNEPRAIVREVQFKGNALTGKLEPIVRISINE